MKSSNQIESVDGKVEVDWQGLLANVLKVFNSEQGIKLLGLLLTGSTGQRMASRNGLA